MQINERLKNYRNYLENNNIEGTFILNPDLQFYLSGFKALMYSRPIVLYIDKKKSSIVVPGLEEFHANEEADVDEVYAYYEHPNPRGEELNHFEFIKKILKSLPTNSNIGVDLDSTPGDIILLIKNSGNNLVDVGEKITELKFIKENQEIELMKKSGKLVETAVDETLKAIKAGTTEMEIDAVGNAALFAEVADKYPDATLDMFVMSPSGPRRSNMPHVFSNTRKLENGDVLIHSRQVGLNGYRAELERTVIIGEPTNEQKKAFEAARIAQQVAIDVIKPGIRASEVDSKAREVFEKDGFSKYAIHRTGHGIGVSAHEKPFLRYDNHELILKEGMAFSIEPGIYIPDVGGFRHSDTIIVTSDGCEVITEYPRDLRNLTF